MGLPEPVQVQMQAVSANVDQVAQASGKRSRRPLHARSRIPPDRGEDRRGENRVEQPRLLRLRSCRRERTIIHTTNTRRAGGHTHLSTRVH